MNILFGVLALSIALNSFLFFQVLLLKQDLKQQNKLLNGTLYEKNRLRSIIIKSKIHQN